jgi:hypothetical protein
LTSNLFQWDVETDAFQQPGTIRVKGDTGSNLPESLGLLECRYIETSRPKHESGRQASNSVPDDWDAERGRHFSLL